MVMNARLIGVHLAVLSWFLAGHGGSKFCFSNEINQYGLALIPGQD